MRYTILAIAAASVLSTSALAQNYTRIQPRQTHILNPEQPLVVRGTRAQEHDTYRNLPTAQDRLMFKLGDRGLEGGGS